MDVALETLFKLAEDGQPREGEDPNPFKNVYPVNKSNLDQQEAWGAAPPGTNAAATALATSSTSVLQELAKNHQKSRRESDDGYPALPSRPLDTSQGLPLGIASSQQKPTVNGYHRSSNAAVLPNQSSTMTTNSAPTATGVIVDNSVLNSSASTHVTSHVTSQVTSSGARPKSNGAKKNENVKPYKSNDEYFRLPLPSEVETAASYNFYFTDIVSSSNTKPQEQTESSKARGTLGAVASVKPNNKKAPPEVLSVQEIESSILSKKSVDAKLGQGTHDGGKDNEPHLKLVPGQQLIFPIDSSVSATLDEPLEGGESNGTDSEVAMGTQPNLMPTKEAPGKAMNVPNQTTGNGFPAKKEVGTPDDRFFARIEKELGDHPTQPKVPAHIMTNEDDDLISELVDSDEDLALAVENELTDSSQKREAIKPVGPPRKVEWQKSFNENEEWENLMKEIDASTDTICTEPIAESVQDFIRENTPAATVDKWFSPVSDSSDESSKVLFPEYRLFPSLSSMDNFLDMNQDVNSEGNEDDNSRAQAQSKILSKLKAASDKKEDDTSSEDSKLTAEQENRDSDSPQRGTNQLPVIKAELSIAAKEFVPRPTPDEPPESDESESSNPNPPMQPVSHPTPMGHPITTGTPPPRPPFSVSGPPPLQMAFPQPPYAVPGPFRVIGPNQMHPMGRPMPPFQGRVIRPAPHLIPPGARPRMPMAPPGARPPGGPGMPPGPPMGFPPRKQPLLPDPGIPPRPLQPRMAGPPGGPQPRMVGLGTQPMPMHHPSGPGMQARFPSPGSPQHRPPTNGPYRHPPPASPSPPFTRPNGTPSPPVVTQPHRSGLIGAPRWPLVQSNGVRRASDTPPTDQVKPLPSDKKVMCLMRGLPGSGKSTLAR